MSSWNKSFTNLFGIICGSILFLGCAASQWRGGSLGKSDLLYEKVRLTYRTDSDRLNAESSASTVAPASYQPNWMRPLPSCSIGIANIQYPHPMGRPNVGQAKVIFCAAGVDSAVVSRSMLKQIQSYWFDEAEQADANSVLEVWTMDIPKHQLDTVVGKLQNSLFFRKKVRTLNPEVFLSAQIDDGIAVGKNCKPVLALDAFIIRVRREGQLMYAPRPSGPSAARPATGPWSFGQHMTRLPSPVAFQIPPK